MNLNIQVSELENPWEKFPSWAKFFFDVGYQWKPSDTNQIAIISVPQKCAASGFVALGLLSKELEGHLKSDQSSHFEHLYNESIDFLELCAKCIIKSKCDPSSQRCGRTEKAKEKFKKVDSNRVYDLLSVNTEGIKVCYKSKATKNKPIDSLPSEIIMPINAHKWHFYLEPPIKIQKSKNLNEKFYNSLVSSTERINLDNLCQSNSSIAYVGTNKKMTSILLNSIFFRLNDEEKSLAELLTIENTQIKRVLSFYSSTSKAERTGGRPKVAVFESISAFKLSVHKLLNFVDKILIVDLQESDTKIQELHDQISTLKQWYEVDNNKTGYLRKITPCKGISSLFLKEC